MPITFELPKPLEDELRARCGDLNQVAKEAFIIENYRAGRISLGKVAELLGMETSLEAGEWLGMRGITKNYSLEDLAADREALDRLLGRGR